MNNVYESYEDRLTNILNRLRLNGDKDNSIEDNIIEDNSIEDDSVKDNSVEDNSVEDDDNNKKNNRLKCKQFDTINYCYEMYKVRKNKKADFDIYSIQKYNIEDDDIDKMEIILGWKDLDNKKKEELLEEYIDELDKKYISLSKNYIKDFVIKNKTKIKYNKKEKKIDDIQGMVCINGNELIIKKKESKSNNLINKLRKSIKK